MPAYIGPLTLRIVAPPSQQAELRVSIDDDRQYAQLDREDVERLRDQCDEFLAGRAVR